MRRVKATATKGRSCGHKRKHATAADAHLHVEHLIANRGAARWAIAAYECRSCGSWHVGHRPGRRAGRRS
jgi:ribosomal protein L40E